MGPFPQVRRDVLSCRQLTRGSNNTRDSARVMVLHYSRNVEQTDDIISAASLRGAHVASPLSVEFRLIIFKVRLTSLTMTRLIIGF